MFTSSTTIKANKMNTANFSELGITVGSTINGKYCQYNSPSNIVLYPGTFESVVTRVTEKFIYFDNGAKGCGFTKASALINNGFWEVVNK